MKHVCLYFQVHQPFRLRNFSFFDIGEGLPYFDDELNEAIVRKVARNCYLPANQLLLELIREHGRFFKVAFSISGTALDQFEQYAPEVIESFRMLANTGCVEFLAETYGHSLAVLKSEVEFRKQVWAHTEKTRSLFGNSSPVFRNTELIYSNDIGDIISDMGFNAMLAEGAAQVLHWKAPHQVYSNSSHELKLLLKHFRLSDDIAFRFPDKQWQEWPLTPAKYVTWLVEMPENSIINLFMDYETFGEHHPPTSGIFHFLKALPGEILSTETLRFITPSEAINELPVSGTLSVPQAMSWADVERDLSAWLGNDLQQDAFNTLYSLEKKIVACNNEDLRRDWLYLQSSDHFYYMSTKTMEDGAVHNHFSPYKSPFDAFINYMNVLSDFSLRLDRWLKRKNINVYERHPVEARLHL